MTITHWRQHESILLAFESSWRSESPHSLDDILRDNDVEDANVLLSELVMIDFEYRWRQKEAKNLDSYFQLYPQLKEAADSRDQLLRHEFRLRKSAGESLSQSELNARFSNAPDVIELWNETSGQSGIDLDSILPAGTPVGSYQITDRIGKGAFATVYAAVDTKLNRDVALKFLSANDSNTSSRIRLRREAQAIAMLKHPNIVPIFGAGNFRGHDYIATRLINGSTLNEWGNSRSITAPNAVEITRQLADALEHAHRAGIIHRDIKPANVMMEDGVPMLLDFGLAHLTSDSQELTNDGDLLGTPAFMPPEQADGRGWQSDPRSDIYSLGTLLYQLVFSRLPFEGSTSEVIGQIINREATIPRDSRNVSRDLQTIILKCLEKEQALRYQSARELQNDLQSYLDGKPIVARPINLAGRVWKWSRRRPMVASLLLGVAILVAFGGGAASQLRHVIAERDRAQLAEQEAQLLLAKSAVDAGRLAMQRGKLKPAVQHFEQALQMGFPDPTEVLLALVEVNFALRNLDNATDLLGQANANSTGESHSAELTLWKAELALADQTDTKIGEELFRQASSMKLGAADDFYVKGILSESSVEAVENLRLATNHDPYHYRSRRMLVFMLMSLARFEDAGIQLHIAQQLFPDDVDFVLLDCLLHAMDGRLQEATDRIADSDLDENAISKWTRFCRQLNQITNQKLLTPTNGGGSMSWIYELSQSLQSDFLPLMRERKWQFPPKISRKFAAFTDNLLGLMTLGVEPSAEALDELVAIHPESTLYLVLGSMRLVDVTATPNGSDEIQQLEDALADYESSLQYPGFLASSDQPSWVSMFTTSVLLALVHKHDVEENKKKYMKASRHIHPETIESASRVRALVIAAFSADDLDEADRWMQRWKQFPTIIKANEVDILWHQAVLSKRRDDWLSARTTCGLILKKDPTNTAAKAFFDKATDEIKAAIEPKDD